MDLNPTGRFSNRVETYVKFRPGYPHGVVETLVSECGLTRDSVVADIGSGTGILTALLLESGCRVCAVEPNEAMRTAAESALGGCDRFTSVDGTAEATTLPDDSIDIVTAGQAFHWFDRHKARDEFQRILKPSGWVALIWNVRCTEATPFMTDYETALRSYGTDYAQVVHGSLSDGELGDVFGGDGRFSVAAFPNSQVLDRDGFLGRALSASYAPAAGHPDHERLVSDMHRIFDRHQHDGTVRFEYETRMFYGRAGDA